MDNCLESRFLLFKRGGARGILSSSSLPTFRFNDDDDDDTSLFIPIFFVYLPGPTTTQEVGKDSSWFSREVVKETIDDLVMEKERKKEYTN